ncbi:MAG: flagellar brake protein, partial [Betaproteobacteria bacterium]
AVPLTETMLRLQRREFYRLLAPVAHPLTCIVTLAEGNVVRYIETRLHDISQGGVSLIADSGGLPAELGRHYPNCRIVLPETGNAIVTLEAVFTCDVTLRNARAVARIGCKYVRPSMPALSLIQRHMLKLECARRARQ